ncbi:MAG: glycosyltransferase [Candidatus Sumerlaeia bacterium]|nr:glycosyltransferase [Candidatus Sumerlaeia bacterium]
MFISMVMVVKNEETVLARCLDSVQGPKKFWDELVITDTGSTDGTIAVAERYGARVQRAEWPKSFAKARNMAAESASPHAQVVVNIDADEVLGAGGERLRARIEDAYARGRRLMSFNYHWDHDEHGVPTVTFARQVIFDPRLYKWTGRAHEALHGVINKDTWEHFDDIVLEHWPKPGSTQMRKERDLQLLREEVAENPMSSRFRFYLARELYYHGRNDEAVAAFQECLDRSRWAPERADARLKMAECLVRLGKEQEALSQLMAAVLEAPLRREPYHALAMHFYTREKWQQAAVWAEAAAAIIPGEQLAEYTSRTSIYTWEPHDVASIAYHKLGQQEKARAHWRAAAAMAPKNERIQGNAKYFG